MAEIVAAETSTNRVVEAAQYEKDVLYIHPSEHSNLTLTSMPLDGTNFLAWHRAVYVSLGTEMKLAFIDGSFPCPPVGSTHYEQWRRVDLTITSWIWNSMSKDIVEAFMYYATSRELWIAIQRRYAIVLVMALWSINCSVRSPRCRNMIYLLLYFTKLMKTWNEITCLAPPPKCRCGKCTCGINEAITESTTSTQLMQFLMGLHERYNSERSQILMFDPLPDIERAFAMVYVVEKQRSIQVELDDATSHMACQLILKDNRRDGDKYMQRRKSFTDKRNVICFNCWKPGHSLDTCVQLHGVPDWYRALNDKRKKNKHFATVVDEKQQNSVVASSANVTEVMTKLIKLLQKNNTPNDPISGFANYDLESKENLVLGVQFKKLYVFKRCDSVSLSSLSVPFVDVSCASTLHFSEAPCDTCHKAKQSRLPFPISKSHSLHPFDLVHMDLWGPYKESNISGCSYVLTLLDDHSRDVQFCEHIFPFTHIVSDPAPTRTPTPLPLVHLQSLVLASSPTDLGHPVADLHLFPLLIDSSSSTSLSPPVPTQIQTLPLRRSLRHTQRLAWLNDFVGKKNSFVL
ncbi:UNVERIFIED_CONTAM: hypothetical protein Scaly_2219300 [Sesamum calycinum]|uniref:Retrotransposon Copia-like N-terminal domain-containing protein n=1 Tax=Sesamum calycinum TaxID=2727403 RepID=A0AAW2MBR6_9LAMI